MGKTCSKLANGLIFCDFKKKLTPGIILTLPRVIYVYITILVKQVYWYISQVSGERLQDHWSSGFLYRLQEEPRWSNRKNISAQNQGIHNYKPGTFFSLLNNVGFEVIYDTDLTKHVVTSLSKRVAVYSLY